MPIHSPSQQTLLAENAELRTRLENAEETLRAIRSGEIDALVVETRTGPKIFTLQGQDAELNRFRGEILTQISDVVIVVDDDQRVTYLNAAAERQYDVTASEVLGCSIAQIYQSHWLQPDDASKMGAALNETGRWRGENVHVKRNGETLHVESAVTRLYSIDGKISGLLAVIRDITDRKRAENRLSESEAAARARKIELETVMAAIPAAIFISHDPLCRQMTGNPFALELLQLPPGHNPSASAPEHQRPDYESWSNGHRLAPSELPMQRAAATGQAVLDAELGIVYTNGEKRHILGNALPLLDDKGTVWGCVGAFMDITHRKHRERRLVFLAEVQKEFSTLSSVADIMRVVCERIAKHLGLTHCLLVEINEATDECTVLNDYRTAGEPKLEGVYRIADFHSEEERQLLKSGEALVINDVSRDVRSAEKTAHFMALGIGALVNAGYVVNGQWKFVLSAMRREPYVWPPEDIEVLTELSSRIYERIERVRGEDALRESNERWRFALQVSKLGAWELNLANHSAWRSLQHDRIFGYNELLPEWTYEIFLQHVLEEDRAEVERCFQQALAAHQDWTFECRIRRADGAVRWIWVYGKHLDAADRPLQRLFGLVGDITERKQAELALKDADRRKDEFLAMLAHELRNPLGPMRNVAQLLKTGSLEATRLSWCGDVVERQVGHLSQLVDDLLDISRITLGKIELKKEPLAVADFVLQAVETSRSLINARRQKFSLTLPEQPLRVEGDRVRLTQIVSNLLNNAAKYTEQGGHINLTIEHIKDQVCIRVRDTGCGIEPSVLPNLFELFYQVDSDIARSQGGLGIGLALVHKLVLMHGGDVQAFSAGLGQGSEFVVRLPLLSLPETAIAVVAADPRPSQGALRILIVDDYYAAAESLAMLLEFKGHQVWIAHDGLSGIEMAQTKHPQVVILDIGLPEMDGYEVAKKLRQCPELGKLFIIALSGYVTPIDPKMLLATTGFDEYQVKPIDIETLHKLLEKCRPLNLN